MNLKKNSMSACFLPFLCCASASSLVDYFAAHHIIIIIMNPHFSLSLYCASTDQPWWLFCCWSSSSLSGTHLDDQLDLWHTEPILCLSHPEASSPAPILWNWIGTFILMFVFWVSVWDALWPRLHIIPNVPKERILGLPHRKNLKLVNNLLKLRHESGDLNSSSHYHVKLIWCLLTLVGSTLRLLHSKPSLQ